MSVTTTLTLSAAEANQKKADSSESYVSRAPVVETDSSFIPRGSIGTTLNFYRDTEDGSKPYNWVKPQPEGVPQNNYGQNPFEVTMNDIRGRESEYSLDKDAFQAIQNVPSKMAYEDWADDEAIKKIYYPEVEKFLLDKVPGAHKITFFDHTVRRGDRDSSSSRGPVTRVHVDQTIRASGWRVQVHDPDEAEELLKGRYRIINVWRSINGAIQSHPLGFASASTVSDDDLVPVELRYPHRTGETAGVRYNANQKFYFWSGMDNDERLLLKCADNKPGVGKSVPHSAFVDSRTPPGAKGRESIEVRTIVYG